MKADFENMTIGNIIRMKGPRAAELIDRALCDNGEKACCPGTTLKLNYAAALKGKKDVLSNLIEEIGKLRNVR